MNEQDQYDKSELNKESAGCMSCASLIICIVIAVFILTYLFSCSASKQTADTYHAWNIDDTFFYKTGGFFRQYPQELFGAGDNWFASNPFMIIAVPDTNSLVMYDTAIECTQDDNYCDTITGFHYTQIVILKSYSTPDKSKFHYSKLTQ